MRSSKIWVVAGRGRIQYDARKRIGRGPFYDPIARKWALLKSLYVYIHTQAPKAFEIQVLRKPARVVQQ